jgi:hypothetical protein
LQTIGPSGIREFPVQLLGIEIRDRHAGSPGPQKELDARHFADLGGAAGGDASQLEQLQRHEELGILDELLPSYCIALQPHHPHPPPPMLHLTL